MCKIIRVLIGNGNYIILILFNYIDYNLFKDERFNISLDFLKICDEEHLTTLLLYVIKNLLKKKKKKISDSEYDDELNSIKNNKANILIKNNIYFSNEIKKVIVFN